MTKVTIPPIRQAFLDEQGCVKNVWYDKLKFLETLQPLSDIPAAAASVTSIDGTTGDFTLGYGILRASQALSAGFSNVTGALGADVLLNNIASYFTGPSITLGTGTWLVVGTVTLIDTGASRAYCKLWDATTVISSSATIMTTTDTCTTLSGIITNPAAAVRISVNNPVTTTGKIIFNKSGNSKDSHITAIRIA